MTFSGTNTLDCPRDFQQAPTPFIEPHLPSAPFDLPRQDRRNAPAANPSQNGVPVRPALALVFAKEPPDCQFMIDLFGQNGRKMGLRAPAEERSSLGSWLFPEQKLDRAHLLGLGKAINEILRQSMAEGKTPTTADIRCFADTMPIAGMPVQQEIQAFSLTSTNAKVLVPSDLLPRKVMRLGLGLGTSS